MKDYSTWKTELEAYKYALSSMNLIEGCHAKVTSRTEDRPWMPLFKKKVWDVELDF